MLIQRRLLVGDELRLFAALATVMGSPREELAGVLRAVGAGTPPWSRLNLVGQALTDLHGKERTFERCEVAVRFASRMGLPQGVVSAWPLHTRVGMDAACRLACQVRISPSRSGSR